MIKVFKIFFHAEGTRPLAVLFCLLLAGASEAVSLTALLPVASQISGQQAGEQSAITEFVYGMLSHLGLPTTLGWLIVLVATAMVVKSVLTFLAISYASYSVAIVSTLMRNKLLNALFKARWGYFTAHKPGKIANAISNDATRAGDAYYIAARFVAFLMQTIVYVIVSLFISPELAGAGLVVGIVLMLVLSRLVGVGRKAGNKQTDQTSELVTYVSDALNNIKPIKAMNRSQHFETFFRGKVRRLRKALVKKLISTVGLLYGQEALKVLAVSGGIYFAVVQMKMPLPELLVIGVIFMQVISIIAKAQNFLQMAATLESAYWRTDELIHELQANEEEDTGQSMPILKQGCRFEQVNFSYGSEKIIHNVSFEVPAGEITVLQGPSGAGKTTLIDLLLGLHRPTSGRISADGISLGDIRLSSWRRATGYVPQELSLLHGSVRDNVTFGDETITDEAIFEALELAGGSRFVRDMASGLDTIVGEMGAKLSGGQRQRIALARALVGKPQLLILDEVTSALDPETEAEICANVARLAGQYTIISITHRPAWAKIATRAYKVSKGRVKAVEVAK